MRQSAFPVSPPALLTLSKTAFSRISSRTGPPHSLLTLCQFRGQHDPAGKQPDDLLIQLIHFLPHLKRISCRLLLFRHLRRRPQQRKIVERRGRKRPPPPLPQFPPDKEPRPPPPQKYIPRHTAKFLRSRQNRPLQGLPPSTGPLRPAVSKTLPFFFPMPALRHFRKRPKCFPPWPDRQQHSAQGQEFYIFLAKNTFPPSRSLGAPCTHSPADPLRRQKKKDTPGMLSPSFCRESAGSPL